MEKMQKVTGWLDLTLAVVGIIGSVALLGLSVAAIVAMVTAGETAMVVLPALVILAIGGGAIIAARTWMRDRTARRH